MRSDATRREFMHGHAIPCDTVQRHAIACNIARCRAKVCDAVQYGATICGFMRYLAINYDTTRLTAFLRDAMQINTLKLF